MVESWKDVRCSSQSAQGIDPRDYRGNSSVQSTSEEMQHAIKKAIETGVKNTDKRARPLVYEITFGRTRRCGELINLIASVSRYSLSGMGNARPALVAKRFNESSLSPIARTCPQRAKEVEVDSARPLGSTSATAIWTEAWSLVVIRRST
jgi:hypothetical protein